MKNSIQRLNLEGTYNTRELGGYPCEKGQQMTRYGQFLRSDRLDALTAKDIEVLKAYGVTTVIDLRSQKEISEAPDTPVIEAGFHYYHCPLMSELMYENAVNGTFDQTTLAGGYARMVMQYERIKAFFEIVLNSEGTVLFHCTGGQDRTGIMSMLLLMVAHVDYCDIINDYLITSTYTSQDTRLQAFLPEGMALSELRTEPACLKAAYDAVLGRYGTIEAYLEACGLTKEAIQALHDRLVGPAGDYRHLPLEGAYNYRDLGGYPCVQGYTKFHRLMRSDDIGQLTQADLDRLYAYGLRTIVDLRFENEATVSPDATQKDGRFRNLSMPFVTSTMQRLGTDATTINMNEAKQITLADLYVDLVKDHALVKKTLEAIAEAEGGILFHCSAGKDRTGVIAMLLLMIAQVGQADIYANYQQTFYYLIQKPEIRERLNPEWMEMMESKVESIAKPYTYIIDHYQDIEGYLKAIGLSESTRMALQNKLVQD